MAACDFRVSSGLYVSGAGAPLVDLQIGGGLLCDGTAPAVNPAQAGLYTNVDGSTVTRDTKGTHRFNRVRTGMRLLGTVSAPGWNGTSLTYSVGHGFTPPTATDDPSGFYRVLPSQPTILATVPAGKHGVYKAMFAFPTPGANGANRTVTLTSRGFDGPIAYQAIVDSTFGNANHTARFGPMRLYDGDTIEIAGNMQSQSPVVTQYMILMFYRVSESIL